MTDFGEKAMIASQVIMTTTMVVNNLVSAIQSIRDPDVSGWEAFKGILGSFITTIPMVISLILLVQLEMQHLQCGPQLVDLLV